jgi:Holliday junction resolvase RusA-like endonuclease
MSSSSQYIEITPMGKPRMTRRDTWKQRDVVVRYRAFCDELSLNLPSYQLPHELALTFFIPMPASWSKRKRLAMAGAPHDQKPDIDNLCKGFMDAFKSEDKHVYALRAEKYWSETGGIEISDYDEAAA